MNAEEIVESAREHHCHARMCDTPCEPEKLMCLKHWCMVPKKLQQAVWAAYRPGKCDDFSPNEAWHNAADAAIMAVLEKEVKKIKENKIK